MLTLKPEDIFIGCRANSKKKALRIAADSLQASGYVSEGFLNRWWIAKRRSLPGSGREWRCLTVAKRGSTSCGKPVSSCFSSRMAWAGGGESGFPCGRRGGKK